MMQEVKQERDTKDFGNPFKGIGTWNVFRSVSGKTKFYLAELTWFQPSL